MKAHTLFLIVSLALPGGLASAGTGSGRVIDLTIRTDDDLLLVKVDKHASPPSCVAGHHQFTKRFDGRQSVTSVASILLSAKFAGTLVRIVGSGRCLPGTTFEEISEVNVGPLGNPGAGQ